MPLLSPTGPVQVRNRDVNDPAAGGLAPLSLRPRGRSRLSSACPCGPADSVQTARVSNADVFPCDSVLCAHSRAHLVAHAVALQVIRTCLNTAASGRVIRLGAEATHAPDYRSCH